MRYCTRCVYPETSAIKMTFDEKGICSYPVQIAVKFKIPLMVWGESGFSDLAGFYSHYGMVEMSKSYRGKGIRGFQPEEFVDKGRGH